MKDKVVQVNLWNKNVGLLSGMTSGATLSSLLQNILRSNQKNTVFRNSQL